MIESITFIFDCIILFEFASYSFNIFISIKGRSNFFLVMALRWLLVLSFLALGNYASVKSIEGASMKLKININTDQGSRHDAVALIKEDEEWKALNDKNREASQRMFVTNPFTGKFIIPGIGRINQIT